MADRCRKRDCAWEWSIFPKCLIRIPDEYFDSPATTSIWIAMRGEESRWGWRRWFGVGRAVLVFPFIYSWHFQCPITHATAGEILLIETRLKPCVSSRDRLRGKWRKRRGLGWGYAWPTDKTEVGGKKTKNLKTVILLSATLFCISSNFYCSNLH